jgi:hypothetical protein
MSDRLDTVLRWVSSILIWGGCVAIVVVVCTQGTGGFSLPLPVVVSPALAKPAVVITPWCPEDAVPVGYGDFDGITWDAYACIPRDDITPGGFAVGLEVQKEDPWALTH